MAFDHLHLYPTVDVVTAAVNIKKMLTLALTKSEGLSMFVHPVGKSLLIDNFDIHKFSDFFLQCNHTLLFHQFVPKT